MTQYQKPLFIASVDELENTRLAADFNWMSVAASELGRVRFSNEDAMLELSEHKLWAVADGLGGLSRGDYASKAVVQALQAFERRPTMRANIEAIESCLEAANTRCQTAFKHKKLGSTVAACFAIGRYVAFIWAGDSRVYRLRKGTLTQMTTDHSVTQEKISRGDISEEEARSHPGAHVLTKAVGVHKKFQAEIQFAEAEDGDRYLICTDGLHNGINETDIQTHLHSGSREQALKQLIDLALERGGRDNITAVITDARNAPS